MSLFLLRSSIDTPNILTQCYVAHALTKCLTFLHAALSLMAVCTCFSFIAENVGVSVFLEVLQVSSLDRNKFFAFVFAVTSGKP